MNAKGIAHKYGDNIDTDVIIPARYLNITDMKELSQYAMIDIDKGFRTKVKKGDLVVAGSNFGCGSSREHAPQVLKESGISCVIASSFARIFFRNAINVGLPILESEEASKDIKDSDTISVDYGSGVITNETTGKTYKAQAFPEFLQNIISKGGLLNSIM